MTNINQLAASRGETTLEFLNRCYKACFRKKCTDGTTKEDRDRLQDNPFDAPRYVLWYLEHHKSHVNGFAHMEMPNADRDSHDPSIRS